MKRGNSSTSFPQPYTRGRGLSAEFLAAMREKLHKGRQRGYVGWDEHWNCCFQEDSSGPKGFLMRRLLEEVTELILAVDSRDGDHIREEAADVANFAMMVADYYAANAAGKDG